MSFQHWQVQKFTVIVSEDCSLDFPVLKFKMDLWAHKAANYSGNTALPWVQVGSLQVWTKGGMARRNSQDLLGALSPLGFLLPTLSTRQGKPASPAQEVFGGVKALPRPSNAKALVGSPVRGKVVKTSAGAPGVDTNTGAGGGGSCVA